MSIFPKHFLLQSTGHFIIRTLYFSRGNLSKCFHNIYKWKNIYMFLSFQYVTMRVSAYIFAFCENIKKIGDLKSLWAEKISQFDIVHLVYFFRVPRTFSKIRHYLKKSNWNNELKGKFKREVPTQMTKSNVQTHQMNGYQLPYSWLSTGISNVENDRLNLVL